MKRLWLLISITMAAPLAAAQNITVLVFGDSLSAAYGIAQEAGWVALTEAELQARYDAVSVVNDSISGETSGGGLARLPATLARVKPQIVVLELGANDGLRGQSLRLLRENLTQMVELSQAQGAEVLLLGMQIPSNYGPAYTRRFSAVFDDLADSHSLAYVPFFLQPVATDPAMFQADGLHPTAAAQPQLRDAVLPALTPLIEALQSNH
ncbi:arylesterase [Granulosicoccaceae sp. 1_MG-2023]|nr:arylesterase [Granulosicoccaceae sp. 1_MG-2023]